MNVGDQEPAHLPSLNPLPCLKYKIKQEHHPEKLVIDGLMKAKYTTPYRESIYDVALDKFSVKYWTKSQLNCFREISKH